MNYSIMKLTQVDQLWIKVEGIELTTKITIIGAGSAFTQNIIADILSIEGLNKGYIGGS